MRIFNAFRTYGLESEPAEDWRAHAACMGYDAEIWFPIGTGAFAERRTQRALEICEQRCPVRVECSRWAVEHGVTDGIWGMPEHELQQRVAAAGTATHRAASRIGTCASGHSRVGNTYIDKNGHRSCTVCAREKPSARKAVASC